MGEARSYGIGSVCAALEGLVVVTKDAILAVDAGGSKCEAILLSTEGELLGYGYCRQPGVSGRGKRAMDEAVAQAYVTGAFRTLFSVGVFYAPTVAAAADGTRPERLEVLYSSEWGTALAQAGRRFGCVLLAGTGAFAHASLEDGRTAHLDGSGPLLGDFGGGYHVGRMALNATVRSDWHPRHRTSLRGLILERFKVQSPQALFSLDLFAQDRSVVASLALLVNQEAEAGDDVSRAILIRAAETLAETFRDLVSVLGIAEQSQLLVGTGSLIRCSEVYWQALLRQVGAIAPRFTTCRLLQPPVVGLAAIGLRHALGPAAEPALERLRRTPIPPLQKGKTP
jgi:N-acetylglucosamine kinase-like BadF-type ATPase